MPKDHFVPQHYLRQFSLNDRTIAVTTLSPYRFIPAAPITGQCQQQNFYEKNSGLNQLLWISEDELAPVLKQVAQNQDFDVQQANALKLQAVVIHMRTRKAAEIAKMFSKYMACAVIRNGIDTGKLPPPPAGEKLEEIIDFKGASAFLMQTVVLCWMEMQTLDSKLLLATGSDFFITSDNPVCKLNQFCAGVEPYRGMAGFSRSGFQLMLPISPRLCYFCYDAKVYKVGNRRDRLVPVAAHDVEVINALQVQSAEQCLYFHDSQMEQVVKRLTDRYASLRVPVEATLQVIAGKKDREELLHLRTHSVKLPAAWSCCKYRRHTSFKPGDRRDPAWTQLAGMLSEDMHTNPHGGDLSARIERILGN